MFYQPHLEPHGLARDPFKACIVPRPIAWVSSQDTQGRLNLAPFSYFNAVSDRPAMVMISCGTKPTNNEPKDTLKNIADTQEFVINVVTYDLREAMNITSTHLERGKSEFELAQLETEPSTLVKPPRVKASPIHLECILHQIIELPSEGINKNFVVLGKVVGIHIDERVLTDGLIDNAKLKPVARLGYMEYACVERTFRMMSPD